MGFFNIRDVYIVTYYKPSRGYKYYLEQKENVRIKNMTIKRFKEMPCPICDKFFFEDDTNEEKEEIGYEGKKDVFCLHCGWKYDLYQVENPDVKNLTNELSLNEYKKWYAMKINENPKYDYLTDNYKPTPHPCPVCGKYDFPDENSFDICPYCGREDDCVQEDDPTYWGGANELSLNDYKKKYTEIIKKNPQYKWFE